MTNRLYYGSTDPLPTRRWLRAGPLGAAYEHGELRYVRLGAPDGGGPEVVRRLYVAVRDRNWGTVPLVLSDERVEAAEDGFRISFLAVHRQDDVDFRWRGAIRGDADGTIRFEMDGQAHATFLRNRIGFCVLHPIRECAGQPAWVEHPDGTREEGVFPAEIAPHQPFFGIRAIGYPLGPDAEAELRFEGDVFEMEDQRNWTDASFKTYGTPLALAYPVEIRSGDAVRQAVTLRASAPSRARSGDAPSRVALSIAGASVGRLPPVGLCAATEGPPPSEDELGRLAALAPAHLRVDLELARPGWAQTLGRAADEARRLGTELEVGLILSDAAEDELSALVAMRAELSAPIVRYLIFHRDEKPTSAGWLRLARERLGRGAPIAGGTNDNFTELNRGRPDPDALDAVVYSINPQVHAFDNDSLIENLAAQAETVRSARAFCGGKPLLVGPVTLRPRHNPDATGPDDRGRPPAPDPRQGSLFGAGWTLGSLKYLSESGASAITYYETLGPRGVIARDGGVYPLYHALADAAERRGAEVLPTVSSAPLAVDGLTLRDGAGTRVLLANMGGEARRVRVGPLPARARVRLLDETTAELATRAPAAFRADPGTPLVPVDGWAELELRPYAVARIDAT